jgi:hypothetical protein
MNWNGEGGFHPINIKAIPNIKDGQEKRIWAD